MCVNLPEPASYPRATNTRNIYLKSLHMMPVQIEIYQMFYSTRTTEKLQLPSCRELDNPTMYLVLFLDMLHGREVKTMLAWVQAKTRALLRALPQQRANLGRILGTVGILSLSAASGGPTAFFSTLFSLSLLSSESN